MSSVTRHPRQPGDRNVPGLAKGPVLRLPRPRSGVEWIDPQPLRESADRSRRVRGRALLTFAYAMLVVVLLVAMLDGRLG